MRSYAYNDIIIKKWMMMNQDFLQYESRGEG